jgi:hypothetical protein
MSSGLAHDTACAAATALVERIENCLREEERRDAYEVFYEIVQAALESYRQGLAEEWLRAGRN